MDSAGKHTLNITIFNGKGTKKVPYSKYEDGTFIFVNKSFDNLKDAYTLLRNEFTLSQSLDIKVPTIIKRKKEELKKYNRFKLDNLILDLDNIKSKEDMNSIINYFKDSNLSVIIGKSRSFNNETNFNLKGIIKVSITNNQDVIDGILNNIEKEIGLFCTVDKSILSTTSFQAAPKKAIIFYNEYGKILTNNDVILKEKENIFNPLDISYDNVIIDKCLSILSTLGFYTLDSRIEPNGCIRFANRNEVKSIGSYFWFANNPIIIHHYNKSKTISIFNYLKDTDEGKAWLKLKSKEEQRTRLSPNTYDKNVKESIIVDERYLDFSKKNKIDLLDKFLDDKKSIFKLSSAMGSAKSGSIEKCIELAHKKGKKVIIVSNRVSVAEDYSNKYNLKLYSEYNSTNYKGSIVVQYDSLHKFDLRNYDVAILDEFQSLILHHRANLTSNSNINAVKFLILLNTKNVLIADAFMVGYEDSFFTNRNIYTITNSYRDNIKLLDYKYESTFISSLFNEAEQLKDNEILSASFTSLNVMKAVELELNNRGINTISLSSETSEFIKELIYKKFKEFEHDSYKVILYTPTLTVGVSILNNIKHHFHYDTGMSTDVISSLQMIKRSRLAKNIHFFLESRQFYRDTNLETLNNQAKKDINKFYNNKNKTLLIDIDYESGNLKLTPLAKYINRIEVFYNILSNNHANAFRTLLQYQFKNNISIIEYKDISFSIKDKIKEVKERTNSNSLKLLEEYSDIVWTDDDLIDITHKTVGLNDEEKAIILMNNVSSKFKKRLPKDILYSLTKKEIESNYSYVSSIKSFSTVLKVLNDLDYGRYMLSKAISSDISSLQNKTYIKFLSKTLELGANFKFKESYSKNNLNKIPDKYFESFLKKIGYKWNKGKLRIDGDILSTYKYI